jgi:hypothetical protein
LARRDQLDAPDQDPDPAGFVDEVDRAARERCLLMGVVAECGQKDHRRRNAARAQFAQHLEPAHLRHPPVQEDHVGGFAGGEMLQSRASAAEARDIETLIHQMRAQGVAVQVVVIDEQHADAALGSGIAGRDGGLGGLDSRRLALLDHDPLLTLPMQVVGTLAGDCDLDMKGMWPIRTFEYRDSLHWSQD